MSAALHHGADAAGEIVISQHAHVVRNDDLGHGVDRDDQSDMKAGFLQLLGHAHRGARAKRMADQHDGTDPPALAALDGLKRKLRYTAYRKGAAGLVSFKAQLTQLGDPTHYRLMLTATAVKSAPLLPGLDLPNDPIIGTGTDPELSS